MVLDGVEDFELPWCLKKRTVTDQSVQSVTPSEV